MRILGEVKQAKDFMKVLEVKISDLRQEISNRDKTIQDKDRDMQNVRLENQSLENYKFVLNFKLDQLSKQVVYYYIYINIYEFDIVLCI